MNRLSLMALVIAVGVAGCSSTGDKKVERLCPQTAIVRELGRINDYGNDTQDQNTLVAKAAMKKVQGKCAYRDEGVDVDFELTIVASRGPRLGGGHFSVPYFISVLDPDQNIMNKEILTADVAFRGDEKIVEDKEDLHVFIPMSGDADGTNYRVLMGFQLTEDQLNENRKDEAKPAP